MSSIASSSSITTTTTSSSSLADWSLFKFIKSYTIGISQEEKDEIILFNMLNNDRRRTMQQPDRRAKHNHLDSPLTSKKLPYQQLDMFSSFSPIHFDYKTSARYD